VRDPDSSPPAFRQVGGRSQSLVRWQNRSTHATMRVTAGLRNMTGVQGLHDQVSKSCGGAPRVAPDAMSKLVRSIGGYVPRVLYRFYVDDLMKPCGSIRVVC
jgi:hypothetical protein